MLPLPKGEGWGEGEQHVRSRCAHNVQIRFPHPAKMWVMTRLSSPGTASWKFSVSRSPASCLLPRWVLVSSHPCY